MSYLAIPQNLGLHIKAMISKFFWSENENVDDNRLHSAEMVISRDHSLCTPHEFHPDQVRQREIPVPSLDVIKINMDGAFCVDGKHGFGIKHDLET